MNKKNYDDVCLICDQLLIEEKNSLTRLGIGWLHVVREHPEILKNYEKLFRAKKIKSIFAWLGIHRISLEIFYLLRQIMRAVTFKNRKKDIQIFGEVDVVFVSHLISSYEVDCENDFYFGNLPSQLTAYGLRALTILIDHTAESNNKGRVIIHNNGTMKFILPNTLKINEEISILLKMWKESRTLTKRKFNSELERRINLAASAEAITNNTSSNLRIAKQISEIVASVQPSTLITTYEGHSWERTTFLESRSKVHFLRCAGYQHAVIFRFQHGIRRSLSLQSDPDMIFTSGPAAQRQLMNSSFGGNQIVKVLGSNRSGGGAKSTHIIKNLINKKQDICLVIPEGFYSECIILFNFSLECAHLLPHIKFILRLHPALPFSRIISKYPKFQNLPSNVTISNSPLTEDAKKAKWSLYRGSTAIVAVIKEAVVPIYLYLKDEMTIDPLYELTNDKKIIKTVNEFMQLTQQETFKIRDGLKGIIEECDDLFSELRVEVLAEYVHQNKVNKLSNN
jgi:hypothetical protein